MATKAGRYDEVLFSTHGTSGTIKAMNADTVQVEVFESDGTTNATLYDDRDKTAYSGTGSIVEPDSAGNIEFFADPGIYVLKISDDGTVLRTDTVNVTMDGTEVGDLGWGNGDLVLDVTHSDYGATGDGSTDDTSAIQSAIDEANSSGGAVFIPRGTFVVTGELTVPSGMTIRGAGRHETTIKQTGVTNGTPSTYYAVFQLTNVSNVEITDLAIIGENTSATSMVAGDESQGIQSDASTTDVTIARCLFQYIWGHGAQSFGASERIAYIDNIVKDCGKNGLNGSGIECRVVGNLCTGNAYNGIEGAYTRSSIVGNQCHRNLTGGVAVVGSTGASDRGTGNTVTGNSCYGNVTGISIGEGVRYSTISDNTVGGNTETGISVTGTDNADNEVIGNGVYNNGDETGSSRFGINLGGTRNRAAFNVITNDANISGYSHQFGIQSFGTDCFFERNRSSGAASWDYDLSGTGFVVDLDTTDINVRFRSGTTIVRGRLYGSGTPEAAWIASPGVTFQRTDGAAGTTLYVKETGTGNTGWVAVPSTAAAQTWTSKQTFSGDIDVSTADIDTLRTKGPVYDVTHPDFGATGDGSTDDTTAIQAAIDAVEAAGGGVVYFPAATYLVSALTVQANGVTFRGDGRTASHLKTASGDLVTFTTGSRFRCEHMKVSSTSGGGHVFVVSDSLSRSEWYDLHVAQSNAAKSILQADDAGAGTLNYIDNVWEHVETYHVAAASVPTFNLRGGGVNRNRWIDWRPTYSGAYTILIETTAASSYANDNTIEGVTGEILDGGFFKGLGVRGTRLADIGSYDHSGATTNHLIEFGQATTGSLHSDQNEVDNARRHGGTLGSGKFDLSATGGDVTLINCGGSTAFSADFNSTESTVIGGNVTGTDDSNVRYLGMDGRDSFLKSASILKAAPELGATFGSPNMTTLGTTSFNYVSWMLGDSSSEAIGGHLDLRGTDWSTFDIVLYWSNNTANSGDVFLQVRYEFFGDGDTAGNGTNANSTVTAPSQDVIEKTTLASGVSVTADKLLAFRLERAGSQAADTLTGDIAVLAIEFVRAS